MLAAGAGAIVNTASVAGMIDARPRPPTAPARRGDRLHPPGRVQYAGTGVRCNCICPGTVDSPWVGRLLDGTDDPATQAPS